MTATRLPLITMLMGPIATAAAAASLCAASGVGTRIPLPALAYRRTSCDCYEGCSSGTDLESCWLPTDSKPGRSPR
jgi:hypothetical protein